MITGYIVIDHEKSVIWGETPEIAFENYKSEFDASPLEELIFLEVTTCKQFYGKANGIKLIPS